ncbi:hypothetical protein C5167_041690, partial [Papaver somniferum]
NLIFFLVFSYTRTTVDALREPGKKSPSPSPCLLNQYQNLKGYSFIFFLLILSFSSPDEIPTLSYLLIFILLLRTRKKTNFLLVFISTDPFANYLNQSTFMNLKATTTNQKEKLNH